MGKPDWALGLSGGRYKLNDPMDLQSGKNPHAVVIYIRRTVNDILSTYVFVHPKVIDKKLIIEFRDKNGIIETMEQDIDKGINWIAFRIKLKELYMKGISDNFEAIQ